LNDINADIELADLAAIICNTLRKAGIKATLVGGAAAALYADKRYLTRDLDFISPADQSKLDLALEPLGFIRDRGRYYRHTQTEYIIEFPSGPIAIGNRYVDETGTLITPSGELQILTPTQSVMDRLAWFFFNNDRQSLDLAIIISNENKVDLEEVRRWAETENELEKYDLFQARLTNK